MAMATENSMASVPAGMGYDRTQLVPAHQGSHVLPNNPLFSRLLRHANRQRVALKDKRLGISRTYGEVLDAVLALREVVRNALPAEAKSSLARGEDIYIGVLAAGGYEFYVAMLTVLSLGAAAVPMFPQAPVDEIVYYATKSQQVMLLSSEEKTPLALDVAKQRGIPHVPILPNLPKTTRLQPADISLSSGPPQDPSRPGVVIFTSGTTGRPKGVVLRRTYTHEGAIAVGDSWEASPNDVLLHTLPVHHTTGLGTSFFPWLNAGACIEFHGKFDAATVLQRWLEGGLTVFSAVPTIYMRLKWHIEQLPEQERAPYIQAARKFRIFLCGSSALQENIQDFWTATRGQPIMIRYGATEIPGCLRVPSNLVQSVPKGSVGTALPGVELKISPEGELLVKTPNMFAKYLLDPEATKNAHDAEGWYKTGDIARREGPYYFITGRASVDILKSGGYKISAIDVERACLTLPYVTEAMVVGVDDEEFGQRVGAVLAVKEDASNVTLDKVRSGLRGQLAGYKLPTLLRVMVGELPKGATGKVQKKLLGPKLIPSPGYEKISEVQVWKGSKTSGPVRAKL